MKYAVRKKPYTHRKAVGAKVAKATKKYVKRVLDTAREDKFFDLNQAIAGGTVATDNSGSIVLMSGVQQGTTFATRVGEVIIGKSLEFRFDTTSIVNGINTANTFVNLRVVIFQDHQIRSSTLPAIADVLETVKYNSPINHVGLNAKRFHILLDKIFELDPNGWSVTATQSFAVATSQSSQQMHKKLKPSPKMTYTNASTGTDLNQIYILYLSDAVTAQAPIVNCYSRLIFEDA